MLNALGKGGTICAMTERVSPRVFRVVALPAPTDREKTQGGNEPIFGIVPQVLFYSLLLPLVGQPILYGFNQIIHDLWYA